jgi:hypothetical protein
MWGFLSRIPMGVRRGTRPDASEKPNLALQKRKLIKENPRTRFASFDDSIEINTQLRG